MKIGLSVTVADVPRDIETNPGLDLLDRFVGRLLQKILDKVASDIHKPTFS